MQNPNQTSQEQRQVTRIQEGNEEAFAALFRAYYEKLCGFAQSRTGSAEVAEDLVQDLFLDLWRRRQDWRLRGSLKAYLYGAVRNKIAKWINRREVRRRWKQEEKRKEAPRGADPEEDFRHRELRRIAQESVAELPPRRRQVYLLSRQHGLTYKEIAEVMGISPKTVENQMVRALKYLREHLKPLLSVVA